MKIDVLIEYNDELSEVTFSSQAAQFTQTRPARIGLSHFKGDKNKFELIEFVGEDWEFVRSIEDLFSKEPTRKDCILRVVNPFEPATFEPEPAFRMIDFFARYILAKIYPKTWELRVLLSFFRIPQITIKIPAYKLFNPEKKLEFEKLLRKRYKNVSFVAQ